jgi:hypothetical protein
MQLLRIPTMLVRICGVLALLLGVSFWTGHLDNLTPVHMLLGIVLVLSLFWLAVANLQQKGSPIFSILAFVDGVALYVVGIGQAGWLNTNAHWLIQVLHLVLALLAIGLGEMLSARLARGAKAAAAA